MKKRCVLIQLSSIGVFALICFLVPAEISYFISAILIFRIALFMRPSKGNIGRERRFQNPQKALLVIDMQEDMCGKKGIYVHGKEFLEEVKRIIEEAQRQGEKVIFIRQEFHRLDFVFCFLAMGGCLLQGTKGAALCSSLKPLSDVEFVKREQDGFTSRELVRYLEEHEIDTVTVVGLDAAACIDKTVSGALNRGYCVTVLKKGIMGKNALAADKALKKLSAKGAVCRDVV